MEVLEVKLHQEKINTIVFDLNGILCNRVSNHSAHIKFRN